MNAVRRTNAKLSPSPEYLPCSGEHEPNGWPDPFLTKLFRAYSVRSFGTPLPAATQKIVQPLEATCLALLQSVAPDMQGADAWRYQRQISPGLEELMEAWIFRHYLEHQQLLDVDAARALLPAGTMLTEDAWMGGLMDSLGECMRWAITGIATGGSIPGATAGGETGTTIIEHMRQLRVQIEALDPSGSGLERDLRKKMDVMKACVDKVEYAAYGMVVRGQERPRGWVPEQGDDRPPVEA